MAKLAYEFCEWIAYYAKFDDDFEFENRFLCLISWRCGLVVVYWFRLQEGIVSWIVFCQTLFRRFLFNIKTNSSFFETNSAELKHKLKSSSFQGTPKKGLVKKSIPLWKDSKLLIPLLEKTHICITVVQIFQTPCCYKMPTFEAKQ